MVAYLLSEGADVTVTTSPVKMQVVHIAAAGRDVEMLDIIVSAGADINVKDKSGNTPLD